MKHLIIFLSFLLIGHELTAQRQRRNWRDNTMKLDQDFVANSELARYFPTKMRAFPLWNMGSFVVIDSREIRPVRNVLNFRPVFFVEILRERDFQERAFRYTVKGPDNFGAVCKILYQNYWERPNVEILGINMPYREYNVSMAAEILPNTGQGASWRIESVHNYGTKYKEKGWYEFFGKIYSATDTLDVTLEFELNDDSDFVIRNDPAHFIGYHFLHKGRSVAALQLEEEFTLLRLVWLRKDIPEHVRNMAGTALPAFLQMSTWIRTIWEDTE